jgi:hypothetical protein
VNPLAPNGAYGVLTEPTTLTLQRLLPGPIERVWAYLTESELRGQWLSRGTMEMKVGAAFELVWHMHLDILVARATGRAPAPFWEGWARLHQEYDRRMPA